MIIKRVLVGSDDAVIDLTWNLLLPSFIPFLRYYRSIHEVVATTVGVSLCNAVIPCRKWI